MYIKYQEALVTHSNILFSTLIVPLVIGSYFLSAWKSFPKWRGLHEIQSILVLKNVLIALRLTFML